MGKKENKIPADGIGTSHERLALCARHVVFGGKCLVFLLMVLLLVQFTQKLTK